METQEAADLGAKWSCRNVGCPQALPDLLLFFHGNSPVASPPRRQLLESFWQVQRLLCSGKRVFSLIISCFPSLGPLKLNLYSQRLLGVNSISHAVRTNKHITVPSVRVHIQVEPPQWQYRSTFTESIATVPKETSSPLSQELCFLRLGHSIIKVIRNSPNLCLAEIIRGETKHGQKLTWDHIHQGCFTPFINHIWIGTQKTRKRSHFLSASLTIVMSQRCGAEEKIGI